ncbi:MAG: hypothetical protein PHQ65_12905 [Bacteroidales bacterium]|nr:hypothetical protein [Bacteroidales bacterium]MDD3666158.1 hypothetical protein [Bacteroidales bacterium]
MIGVDVVHLPLVVLINHVHGKQRTIATGEVVDLLDGGFAGFLDDFEAVADRVSGQCHSQPMLSRSAVVQCVSGQPFPGAPPPNLWRRSPSCSLYHRLHWHPLGVWCRGGRMWFVGEHGVGLERQS